jgi:hypothetical protein
MVLARGFDKSAVALLTFAFCWTKPMLAALAMMAGMARTAANFMM